MAVPNPQQTEADPASAPPSKPIHSLVLDTGPLIKNDPSIDVLRARAEQFYILPSVIPEIRDAATRTRVETAVLPFATVRAPKPDSLKFVINFARRTGDLEVLSRPDLEVLALTYELECERNGGDWRLRNTPGQKTLNGSAPGRDNGTSKAEKRQEDVTKDIPDGDTPTDTNTESTIDISPVEVNLNREVEKLSLETTEAPANVDAEKGEKFSAAQGESVLALEPAAGSPVDGKKADESVAAEEQTEVVEHENDEEDDDDEDDGGGWITPSNLKKQKAKDDIGSTIMGKQPTTLQAAVLTSDFAMQNVALRMNLNLVAPSLARISRLRTWVLRCHGCFKTTRDMERRFCPTCGQPTLIRTACTIDDRTGELKVHLKRNFQWNNRGNVYSVPKPVAGSSNGRMPKGKGKHSAGGKNGWGADLILAEDQKEHTRAAEEQRRSRKKNIMDEDMLPGILSGRRDGGGGRIRVGAGRNVNSRKRS
ncbi:RNA-binding protein NOB1 [Geosmithia morbida]|uniref:20S-pre-rRNA D-site endonuclease NOB1 n=1 Tax=Geosmithia morbida TaxID=1094350 RepID=A0A9P4YS33_9HYPO|nr:RNA-binding protein NOB1 [Geosmithia morbida]KAF4120611.1 RNA-binding protein NOB1 [Geosmithia morbida]